MSVPYVLYADKETVKAILEAIGDNELFDGRKVFPFDVVAVDMGDGRVRVVEEFQFGFQGDCRKETFEYLLTCIQISREMEEKLSDGR